MNRIEQSIGWYGGPYRGRLDIRRGKYKESRYDADYLTCRRDKPEIMGHRRVID